MSISLIRRICVVLVVVLLVCFSTAFMEDNEAEYLFKTGFLLLLSENSTEADIREGMNDIVRAAQMENPDAAYMLGVFFENGLFVDQDYEEAFAWYYQCLQYGSIDALYKVGQFAEFGYGIPKDEEMAVLAYQTASEYGHTDSMKALAYIWMQHKEEPGKLADSKNLLEKAAQYGDTEAMNGVAWCYEYGVGTDVDYKQAGYWFGKALDVSNEKIFYGMNPDVISQKLTGGLFVSDDVDADFHTDFYKAVWIRKHQNSQETSGNRHIVNVMVNLYPMIEEKELSEAVFNCVEWIYSQEPGLEEKTERAQYGERIVSYSRSLIAQYFFDEGYHAFDERNYQSAEECYKTCIEMDPCDLVARFELAETYIASGRLNEARQELNNLVSYVNEDVSKAQYYRRIGFIAIDQGNYELGGACMLYSLHFSESTLAHSELLYIKDMTGVYPDYDTAQIQKILENNKVHIWEIE